MNINPIKMKLQKMFGKSRRNKKTQTTHQSTLNQSNITCQNSQLNFSTISMPRQTIFLSSSPKDKNESLICMVQSSTNKENTSYPENSTPNTFKTAISQLSMLRSELQNYKKLTKKLEEKLNDQYLLEEFYLQELKERNQVQRELKWKLEILGEEIRNKRVFINSQKYEIRKVQGTLEGNWSQVVEGDDRGFSLDY